MAPAFGPPEDEEEYARRIWQEMEKRKRQQSSTAASAARSYFAAQAQANSAREQAAFDAAQRSRQILEEEMAKDRAWREAVLKVLLAFMLFIAFSLLWCHAANLHPSTLEHADDLERPSFCPCLKCLALASCWQFSSRRLCSLPDHELHSFTFMT